MWPEESFNKIRKLSKSDKALICSFFTLGHEWRKECRGINAKYLLCSMATKYLTTTNYSFMVGTVVRMSNIHKMAYDLTAEMITENIDEKGVNVDLIVWHKDRLTNFTYPKRR